MGSQRLAGDSVATPAARRHATMSRRELLATAIGALAIAQRPQRGRPRPIDRCADAVGHRLLAECERLLAADGTVGRAPGSGPARR